MAEQTFSPGTYTEFSSPRIRLRSSGSARPRIIDALTPSGNPSRFFAELNIYGSGRINLFIASSTSESASNTGDELSDTFETSGHVRVTLNDLSLTFKIGSDVTEPYIWTPDNSNEVTAFVTAVFALIPDPNAADFDITISDVPFNAAPTDTALSFSATATGALSLPLENEKGATNIGLSFDATAVGTFSLTLGPIVEVGLPFAASATGVMALTLEVVPVMELTGSAEVTEFTGIFNYNFFHIDLTDFSIPSSWVVGGVVAYLSRIQLFRTDSALAPGRLGFFLAPIDPDPSHGIGAGPSLIDAVKQNAILTLTFGSASVVIQGIFDTLSGNLGSDPYQWVPSNAAAVGAFGSALSVGDMVTVTLRYEAPTVETHDIGLSFAATAQATFTPSLQLDEVGETFDVGLDFSASAVGALSLAVAHTEAVETFNVGLSLSASAVGALSLAVRHIPEAAKTHDIGLSFNIARRVTLPIGVPTHTASSGAWVQWDERDNGLGDLSLFANPAGGSRHLIRLRIFSTGDANVQFQVIDTPDGGSGFGSAEELTDAWEKSPIALTLNSAGIDDLVLTGPDHTSSPNKDTTEPYAWTPAGIDTRKAWFTAYSSGSFAAVTLIVDDNTEDPAATATGTWALAVNLRDSNRYIGLSLSASAAGALSLAVEHEGVETHDIGLSFAATAQATFTPSLQLSEVGETHDIGLSFSASAAATFTPSLQLYEVGETHDIGLSFAASAVGALSLAIEVIEDIDLSSFPTGNLVIDCLALISRTQTGTEIYRDANRGGSDIPVAGELGIGPDNTWVSRIRLTTSTNLLINISNRNGPLTTSAAAVLALFAYFGAFGDGIDEALYIQTSEGIERVLVAGNDAGVGGGYLNLTISAAMGQLLQDLEVGRRLNFAFAHTQVDIGLSFAATAAAAFTPSLQLSEVGETFDIGLSFAATAAATFTPSLQLDEVSETFDVGLSFAASAVGALSLSVAHAETVETHDIGLSFTATAQAAFTPSLQLSEVSKTFDIGLSFSAGVVGALSLAVERSGAAETHDIGLSFSATAAAAFTPSLQLDITSRPSVPGPPRNLVVSGDNTDPQGALNLDWDTPLSDGNSSITGYKIEEAAVTTQTFVVQDGKDGNFHQFVFHRTSGGSPTLSQIVTPAEHRATRSDVEYIPTGTTDDPQGVSATLPYEWGSVRFYDPDNTPPWTEFGAWFEFSHHGMDGTDGTDGTDGVGAEYIFTASTSPSQHSPSRLPNNSWTYDQTGSRGGQTYSDGAEGSGFGSTNKYLHRYSRKPTGSEAVSGGTVASSWVWDGVISNWAVDGEDGTDGTDGVGAEYIFTASTSPSQPGSSRRPNNSWTYDQTGSRGGQTYSDGAEGSGFSSTNRYLHRYSRKPTGSEAVNGHSVASSWVWDGVVSNWALDGEDGVDGTDGVGAEYVFTATTGISQPASSRRPSNSWTYDQTGSVGGQTYSDGAEGSGFGSTNRYLHRYGRKPTGSEAVDGMAVASSWVWNGVVSNWALDGMDATPVELDTVRGAGTNSAISVTVGAAWTTVLSLTVSGIKDGEFVLIEGGTEITISGYQSGGDIDVRLVRGSTELPNAGGRAEITNATVGGSSGSAATFAKGSYVASSATDEQQTFHLQVKRSANFSVISKRKFLSVVAMPAATNSTTTPPTPPTPTPPTPTPPAPPVTLRIDSIADAHYDRGDSISEVASAIGGTSPYTWSISSSLVLSIAGNGDITSAPIGSTRAGSYSTTVTVMDDNGMSDTETFIITVPPRYLGTIGDLPPTQGPPVVVDGSAWAALDYAPHFAGEAANGWSYSVSPASRATVTGTTAVPFISWDAVGTVTITITASNAAGSVSHNQTVTITSGVSPPTPPTPTPPTPPTPTPPTPPTPALSASISPTSGVTTGTVMTATVGGPVSEWAWQLYRDNGNFGGNATSGTGSSPPSFTIPSTRSGSPISGFRVQLRVWDSGNNNAVSNRVDIN